MRVNTICIHFGVAAFDSKSNQMGFPGTDTRELGAIFVDLAKSAQKGEIICGNDIDDLRGKAAKFTQA